MKKSFLLPLETMLLSTVVSTQTFAADFTSVSLCPKGAACEGTTTAAHVIIPNIINFLFVLAIVLAVIFLILGGIKWITAGGDKTKVQAARETIIGAIIGLVIVFAAYFIINFVLKFIFGQGLGEITIPTIFK